MPINDFEGDTFVAFLDISGFKKLMKDEEKAWNALDELYNNGYLILRNQNNDYRVEGIFISDCGILFVRNVNNDAHGTLDALKILLEKIKKINIKMRDNDFMLTTSIAYGKFKYQERIEFEGIDKNAVYGNAYVLAFMDNENGKPKIKPGQCRILKNNLPNNLHIINQDQTDEIFKFIQQRERDFHHYYFYWMVNNTNRINNFEQQYRDAYNLKYAGMLKAIKGNNS